MAGLLILKKREEPTMCDDFYDDFDADFDGEHEDWGDSGFWEGDLYDS